MARRMSGITRRDLLKTGIACAVAANSPGLTPLAAKAAAHPAMLWGVNLAGADFGNLLGKHGTEYLYPTPANIDYYAQLGFTLVRIPFKWERLQPQLNASLDPAELSLLAGVVDHALRCNLTVVLDPHNYAKRRRDADGWMRDFPIGSAEVPLGAFLDFWRRLADVFEERERVVFGLMNEPVGLAPSEWLEIANAAIDAIRGRGARNLLLVPGTAYTGAHSWFDAGNTVMERVRDPMGNFAFEVHQYLDRDSSGTKPDAVSSTIGSERIEAFQDWARERGFRAFLGEYGVGRDDVSARALMDLCDELSANSDVWLGTAAWAGGPRWPEEDMFNLEPYKDGRMREQTGIIRSRATADTARRYWSGATPTLYADLARGIAAGVQKGVPVLRFKTDAGPDITSLPIDRKGLRLDARRPISLTESACAVLLRQPSFTILVETRTVLSEVRKRDILSLGDASFLYCGAQGELCTDFGGGLATFPLAREAWAGKRRCAFSFNAATGETAIAVTGVLPVRGKASGLVMHQDSFADGLLEIQLGAGPYAPLDGYVCRIIGFPFLPGDAELAEIVA